MDRTDIRLLKALHDNGRLTIKALSEAVNLSQPSCAERIRRLQERGIIDRFSIILSPRELGYPITALVRVRPLPGELARVEKLIIDMPEVSQCDKVTGDDAFICRLHLRNIEDLDPCLIRISAHATTSTAIVKASPVSHRLLPLIPD